MDFLILDLQVLLFNLSVLTFIINLIFSCCYGNSDIS